jgi:hypothetical protein
VTVRGEPTWQPISALPTIAMLIDVVGLASSRTYVVCGHARSSAESRREFGAGADDRVSSMAGAHESGSDALARA